MKRSEYTSVKENGGFFPEVILFGQGVGTGRMDAGSLSAYWNRVPSVSDVII